MEEVFPRSFPLKMKSTRFPAVFHRQKQGLKACDLHDEPAWDSLPRHHLKDNARHAH